ncbi:MAG: AbrB/MazE/SpoVT family DNA-binding domain-containing protein [Thaumarchaeota archaeon]|nr:AbrB/MazE/SpoVT family DNA-binding domain-containing protein [Nitrososphaerota archaeon]
MTAEEKLYPSKVGPKGQIVIPKELRSKYGIRPGIEVEQLDTGKGILVRPAELTEQWKQLALNIGKKWPKRISAVQAIREDREKTHV